MIALKRMLVLLAAMAVAATAHAHGPDRGKNGGRQVDAGRYHIELVAKDKALSVYISDEHDVPVDASGFKGTGIFVMGGKPQRIEIKHETANKLSGTSTVALPADVKGAVQIMLPEGGTVQAKFE